MKSIEKFYHYLASIGYDDLDGLAILVTSLNDVQIAWNTIFEKYIIEILSTPPENFDALLGLMSDIHIELVHVEEHVKASKPIVLRLMRFIENRQSKVEGG